MRLLNIMLARVKGGVETMAVHYHEALRAEGFEVLSLGHPEGMLAEALPGGEFGPLSARVNHDPFTAWALHGYDRDFRPDLVLTHGNRATGIALLPLIGTRPKTVQIMHNQFIKGHLGSVKAALCVSASVRDAVKAVRPDLKVFDVGNFSRLEERPVKAPPEADPVIGVLGRLHEQKGFDILLKALAELRDRGQGFSLKIAGDGPERAALESLTRELDLEARVEFLGWVSEVADYLSGLDLFVLPSRYEPFGLVVIEAMAAGLPVVASDREGPREILQGGDYGLMFPAEDVPALASAMAAAFSDWPATLAMARRGQRHALEAYGFDAGRRRLKDALEAVMRV